MEKLLWAAAAALGLAGVLLLIFSPIGKVIGLCVFALGCVKVPTAGLMRHILTAWKPSRKPNICATYAPRSPL